MPKHRPAQLFRTGLITMMLFAATSSHAVKLDCAQLRQAQTASASGFNSLKGALIADEIQDDEGPDTEHNHHSKLLLKGASSCQISTAHSSDDVEDSDTAQLRCHIPTNDGLTTITQDVVSCLDGYITPDPSADSKEILIRKLVTGKTLEVLKVTLTLFSGEILFYMEHHRCQRHNGQGCEDL